MFVLGGRIWRSLWRTHVIVRLLRLDWGCLICGSWHRFRSIRGIRGWFPKTPKVMEGCNFPTFQASNMMSKSAKSVWGLHFFNIPSLHPKWCHKVPKVCEGCTFPAFQASNMGAEISSFYGKLEFAVWGPKTVFLKFLVNPNWCSGYEDSYSRLNNEEKYTINSDQTYFQNSSNQTHTSIYIYIYTYNQVPGTGAFVRPVGPGVWTMGGRMLCFGFWPNVRDSGRTWKFMAGRLEKRKSKGRGKVGKRASRISRWSKIDLWNMNIGIPGSKTSNIIVKQPKIANNILKYVPKKMQKKNCKKCRKCKKCPKKYQRKMYKNIRKSESKWSKWLIYVSGVQGNRFRTCLGNMFFLHVYVFRKDIVLQICRRSVAGRRWSVASTEFLVELSIFFFQKFSFEFFTP